MSLRRRVSERIRRMRPERVVTRHVQGVDLVLPWSHRLPDYVEAFPQYGQNLVAIAGAVALADRAPFAMIDIGANVGDSALQVLSSSVDARVLCVEGDAYWLDFLHRNVDRQPRITVVPALVVADGGASLAAVRKDGSSHFVEGDGDGVDRIRPEDLKALGDDLGRVRLIKCDTDGYDAVIVPALARVWADHHPVVFLEYEPTMTREVGNEHPEKVWSDLAALGYDFAAVWDNRGDPLGTLPLEDVAEAARVLDGPEAERGYRYWDVAVAHRDDSELRDALSELVGGVGYRVAK